MAGFHESSHGRHGPARRSGTTIAPRRIARMIQAKKELLEALGAALAQVEPNAPPAPVFESPKHASHGDLACTAAMAMARALKKNPREVASALVDALKRQPAVERWVSALEIAGPGF